MPGDAREPFGSGENIVEAGQGAGFVFRIHRMLCYAACKAHCVWRGRTSEFEGHCLRGAVKFAVAPPTLFFAHCHCHYCRDAHGAAFVSWVGAAEARFRYLPGSTEPQWYQSSQQSRRGFRSNCGTTLFFASSICRGEIHIARPAIQGPMDREPQCHVFCDQHADWIEAGDRLPQYTSEQPGLAKYEAVRS